MKRRDIKFGDVQDECGKRKISENEVKCGGCPYDGICAPLPCNLNLTDPPRFNEQQMAFWRGLFAIGIKRVRLTGDQTLLDMFNGDAFAVSRMSISSIKTGLEAGETLDLAELLGKDEL